LGLLALIEVVPVTLDNKSDGQGAAQENKQQYQQAAQVFILHSTQHIQIVYESIILQSLLLTKLFQLGNRFWGFLS
jgi:hypothetical protein